MPRYYFNLRHKPGREGLAIDPEGEELLDLNAVRERALEAARDMIAKTRTYVVRDWTACSFEIENEDAQCVLTVLFSAVVPDVDYG